MDYDCTSKSTLWHTCNSGVNLIPDKPDQPGENFTNCSHWENCSGEFFFCISDHIEDAVIFTFMIK